ncbi:MarR family transcriptional regulator [Halogeometricum borinquense]|uniref:MarR family transcriptional regulator n=1 Tax=Halogeometricum borinquense TaxID=60847 RepID=A0A6C0UM98_9EURY|nr:MarR family transcriptional regulator [Halogeometricum borinquense]QIB75703.1 MarR family transcriptional regulator [Halogeometricum borinquense]
MSEQKSWSADDTEEVQYDLSSGRYGLFECATCDNIVLAFGRGGKPMSCHGEPMQQKTDCEMDIKSPDIRQVLFQAFGLPKAGLDICLYVIGDGPLSASEVAETLGYDRSTMTRYLNKLVDLGLLRRSELNREDGGVVNMYHSVDLDRMRRQTLLGFYVWAGEAAALIEEANLTKQDYLERNPDKELPDVFWDSLPDD